MEKKAIRIPTWMREELPRSTEFCEIINELLERNPKMTLAEFAKALDEQNVQRTHERIIAAEKKQFGYEEVTYEGR